MSRLVNFYRDLQADAEGRFLSEILAWPDDDLETAHDFIQWLFSLPEPSRFNSAAPLLTDEDIADFKSDPVIQDNLRSSFQRLLKFFGLSMTAKGEVAEDQTFAGRIQDVWASPNHNWLRISRILRSFSLLGMDAEALALYRWLNALYGSRKFPITAETFQFWAEAAGRPTVP